MTRYLVLALLVLVFLSHNAEAATLFGRVIEVNDGDVITVFNLNRPVRIKLMAIDAPEAGQPFGDVARKHLSDLVYDKNVLVEYWGIAPDGSLVGRVTLSNVDIGVQMIRDGAAWFDASNQGSLSAADREIYQQSEQAARSERRGLWQGENPIAPWEFVRAQALRRNPAASLNAILPANAKLREPSELNNMTLMAARLAPSTASRLSREDSRPAWTPPRSWQRLQPPGENFSALVPEGGVRAKLPTPIHEQTDINVYMARDGWSVYVLAWANGPSSGESDEETLSGSLQAFIKGVGESYENRHLSAFSCELQNEHRFSANGFRVSEYDLPTCTIPTKIRAFTRVTRGIRQLYIGTVFYPEADANVARFMKSFTLTTPVVRPKRPLKKSGH